MSDFYEGDDRRKHKYSNIDHRFYEKPLFSLGTMITLAAGLISVLMYVTEIDQGVDANTAEIRHVRQLQAVQNGKMEQAIGNVEKQYEKIDAKLDMLIRQQLNVRRQ